MCIQNSLAADDNRLLTRWTVVMDLMLPKAPETDYYGASARFEASSCNSVFQIRV